MCISSTIIPTVLEQILILRFLKSPLHNVTFTRKKNEIEYYLRISWTINCAELSAVPARFTALHVYVPRSVMAALFISKTTTSPSSNSNRYFLPSRSSLPSLYQIISGSGSPRTRHCIRAALPSVIGSSCSSSSNTGGVAAWRPPLTVITPGFNDSIESCSSTTMGGSEVGDSTLGNSLSIWVSLSLSCLDIPILPFTGWTALTELELLVLYCNSSLSSPSSKAEKTSNLTFQWEQIYKPTVE